MNDIITKTYMVASCNIFKLSNEIDRLNRRAARLGVPQVSFRFTGNTALEKRTSEITGEVVQVRGFSEVEITGQAPKFAGWNLAAVLEHTPEGNIIRKSPECAINLMAYRDAKPVCQHCNTLRNRKDTYLVAHDDGSVKQVGHDCIKDFLGHKDPHALAHLAELWFSISELGDISEDWDGFGGGSRDNSIYTKSLLAYAALAIRRFGYVSRKYQQEHLDQHIVTTREQVMAWMFPSREDLARAARRGESWPRPEEQDCQFAEKAVEYVRETLESKPELSEFDSNILIASKLEAIEARTAGIACYVPEFYRRSFEQKAKQASANNAHFGEVGKRYKDIQLEYVKTISWDSNFGTQYRHSFYTPERVLLSWKTGTDLSLAAGAKVTATFTVKAHSEWKGWKQTDVSRAKVA